MFGPGEGKGVSVWPGGGGECLAGGEGEGVSVWPGGVGGGEGGS